MCPDHQFKSILSIVVLTFGGSKAAAIASGDMLLCTMMVSRDLDNLRPLLCLPRSL
jgi:hypothetical protein